MRWGDLIVEGDARRLAVVAHGGNGVDGVEVHTDGERLLVFFLRHVPRDLRHGNVRIDAPHGSRPVRAIAVHGETEEDRELEDPLIVELDRRGGRGRYRLSIVDAEPDGTPGRRPYHGLDPRFAGAAFEFDVDAPRPPGVMAPPGGPAADDPVSYLYRDYAGLRQLMLDRLGVTMPAWSERHEPDVWITLIELLAYVGDDLSYYEDAVATEAYLSTARNRISVRRHARLVDYRLSEGCNARTWVCVEVSDEVALPLGSVRLAAVGAYAGDGPPVLDARSFPADRLAGFPQYSPLAAQPGTRIGAGTATLLPAHNAITLWSWGEADSRLAAGATRVALVDGAPGADPKRVLALAPGDVLILEEKADTPTLGTVPADPTLRQAVRLTEVRRTVDRLYRQPLLEVAWAAEDALAFDLPVCAGGAACSRASGNVLLIAAGVPATDTLTLTAPSLTRSRLGWAVPFPDPALVARHQARRLRGLYGAWRAEIVRWLQGALEGVALDERQLAALRAQFGAGELERLGLSGGHGRERGPGDGARAEHEALALAELLARAGRLLAPRRRRLEVLARLAETRGPLEDVLLAELADEWGEALTADLPASAPAAWGPAAAAITQDPVAALPVLSLAADGDTWSPAPDLVDVAPSSSAFVAEIDDGGIARLRIANPPAAGTLTASYWIGNGRAGNVEAEAINAIVFAPPAGEGGAPPPGITLVRNPLPVTGGIDAETAAAAKLAIPGAFAASQPRALVAADYAALASAVAGVRRATAEARFTGTLTAIHVAVQPELGEDPGEELLDAVRTALARARRIAHHVRVVPPRYRPLVLVADVALWPDAIRFELAHRLARVLSSGWTAAGTPALFNPERLAFAAPVFASPIVAALQGVAGVASATITRFGFLDPPPAGAAAELNLGTLEIARLDNDPARPEHGYAVINLEGGR